MSTEQLTTTQDILRMIAKNGFVDIEWIREVGYRTTGPDFWSDDALLPGKIESLALDGLLTSTELESTIYNEISRYVISEKGWNSL